MLEVEKGYFAEVLGRVWDLGGMLGCGVGWKKVRRLPLGHRSARLQIKCHLCFNIYLIWKEKRKRSKVPAVKTLPDGPYEALCFIKKQLIAVCTEHGGERLGR